MFSQESSIFSFRGDVEENLLATRTVSGEFYQRSDFALKRGATVAVDTLCNFLMVMSGVAFKEK